VSTEFSPAKWASGIVVLPSLDTDNVEIFFAGAAILQFFVLLIHFSEANGAISIVLKVDFFRIFSSSIHSRSQSIGQLLIEDFVCSL